MFDSRPLLCAGLAAGLMCALTACEVRRTDVRPRRSAIAAPGAISPPSAPAAEMVAPDRGSASNEVIQVKQPEIKELPWLKAAGTHFVDPEGRPVILRGCNLGNWLMLEMWMLDLPGVPDQFEFEAILARRFGTAEKDRLLELYRAQYIRERDFPIIRSFGFNTVRLPFNYRLLLDDNRPGELKPNAFHWLDTAVALARRHGLYVILDMHGTPGGQSGDHTTGRRDQNRLWTSEEDQQRTAWLWARIAEHYQDCATVAAYDLINEPYGERRRAPGARRDPLVEVADRIYAAIRAVDTNHVILFSAPLSGIEIYGAPQEHGWGNVGFTEHYYPGMFGMGDPTPETHAKFIARHLPSRAYYLEQLQAPFLVGEFNVVHEKAGGAPLMRKYYDLYGELGWAATMWCYKLVKTAGGMGRDSWAMVSNRDPLPAINISTSRREEIETWIHSMGTMEYAVNDRLGAALTAPAPPPVDLPPIEPLPIQPPATNPLVFWQATDVGGALPGGQKVIAAGDMDIYGGGADIWQSRDQFRFIWREVDGEFELTATLAALAMSHEYAKAGLMIRTGNQPEAAFVMIHVFPGGGISLAHRSAAGQPVEEKLLDTFIFPIRLALRRVRGSIEVAYASAEGQWHTERIGLSNAFGPRVLAGLAVLSHDNRYLTTAEFRNIRLLKR